MALHTTRLTNMDKGPSKSSGIFGFCLDILTKRGCWLGNRPEDELLVKEKLDRSKTKTKTGGNYAEKVEHA
jgi:hypothetical protein